MYRKYFFIRTRDTNPKIVLLVSTSIEIEKSNNNNNYNAFEWLSDRFDRANVLIQYDLYAYK